MIKIQFYILENFVLLMLTNNLFSKAFSVKKTIYIVAVKKKIDKKKSNKFSIVMHVHVHYQVKKN